MVAWLIISTFWGNLLNIPTNIILMGENNYKESSNIFFDIKDAKLSNWIGHSVMKLLGLKEAVSCEN